MKPAVLGFFKGLELLVLVVWQCVSSNALITIPAPSHYIFLKKNKQKTPTAQEFGSLEYKTLQQNIHTRRSGRNSAENLDKKHFGRLVTAAENIT